MMYCVLLHFIRFFNQKCRTSVTYAVDKGRPRENALKIQARTCPGKLARMVTLHYFDYSLDIVHVRSERAAVRKLTELFGESLQIFLSLLKSFILFMVRGGRKRQTIPHSHHRREQDHRHFTLNTWRNKTKYDFHIIQLKQNIVYDLATE